MSLLKTSMAELDKSIIFILDKLSLFAEHPHQRLLYNLFDLAANFDGSLPILVIGVTDVQEVVESFEKRVKSRFSHRQINLAAGGMDWTKYKEKAKTLLSTACKVNGVRELDKLWST
jgi:origin recognition complex subunit 4